MSLFFWNDLSLWIFVSNSIYDIYFISRDTIRDQYGVEDVEEREIHVAHYWFNGDTGNQIHWVAEKPYTDWGKVESA